MNKFKNILVTGGSGQLGQSIRSIASDYPEYEFFFADRQLLDLSNEVSFNNFFGCKSFDVIINCAAYTAVDKAELEPELADQINHLAVCRLAKFVNRSHAKLIHISTDYVFNGQKCTPYIETDEVGPLGTYGKTKLRGEEAIKKTLKTNSIIIRTSWLYSEYGNNFFKTMMKRGQDYESLSVVLDQIGTPTYAKDLATAIMTIIQSKNFRKPSMKTSVFHYSNEGACSWYDFALAIFELAGIQCQVIPIETIEFPTPASRPHFSVLNKTKIKSTYQTSIPYWRDSVKHCLTALKKEDH